MIRPDDIALLPVFHAVARRGGFTAAAGPLGITPSAVSQKVRQFEARLGMRLFDRTSRSVSLTEFGRRLLDDTANAFDDLSGALERARTADGEPAGTIRINLSRLAAEICVMPRLAGFVRAYPKIVVELTTDDRLTDIVAGGYDAGIRMTESLDMDMIARTVGPPLRRSVLASPDYLERHGIPTEPQSLGDHQVIRYRFPASQRLQPLSFRIDDQLISLDPPPRLVLDDNTHISAAVREGIGLAQRFRITEQDAIRRGELVEILAEFEPQPLQFHLYYSSRSQPPKMRAFIDWFTRDR